MATPEKSVDEIVQEFAEHNDCIMCYGKQERPLERLREIIKAERQKREEVVERIKELEIKIQSIWGEACPDGCIFCEEIRYRCESVMPNLTQPNNPE